MERAVNKVILLGRCGQTPDSKYTTGGTAVCKFSLATTDRYKDKSGGWTDKTEWHFLSAFGKLAEIAQQFVKKGDRVYIEGALRTSSWEDKSTGEKKYRTEILVNELVLLGEKESHAQTEDRPEPF